MIPSSHRVVLPRTEPKMFCPDTWTSCFWKNFYFVLLFTFIVFIYFYAARYVTCFRQKHAHHVMLDFKLSYEFCNVLCGICDGDHCFPVIGDGLHSFSQPRCLIVVVYGLYTTSN